jgi:hypothetical protein
MFLSGRNLYRQIAEVYSEDAINKANLRKWYRLFKEDKTNINDEK